ncbi:zinc-binding alcohol dehydrogenase family protein [Terriglobus sp. RCC_193]|uniref:quinone oxidoreductase family protein n=1 Tax=Terriglobus sp. RCC_193 TaxID=3239218 RepID=UPI003523821F
MKAIIVRDFESTPSYGDFPEPIVSEGEVKITVAAATLAPIVRSIAQGKHYAGSKELPFVPGIDGVGRLPNGNRVYFLFPRAPFGSMAEYTVPKLKWCVPVPDDVDDVTAAAVPNSGISSWIALTVRGDFRPSQVVVVNGATGSAGSLAVRVAKHLGASKIIATGRDVTKLEALKSAGANVIIPLEQPEDQLVEAYRQTFDEGVDVVLDYLGGIPAERMIRALARGRGSAVGEPRIRFVQVGGSAGKSILVDTHAMRSTGLEIVGSGLGAFSIDTATRCAGELLNAISRAGLSLPTQSVSFADVDEAWKDTSDTRKIVFRP